MSHAYRLGTGQVCDGSRHLQDAVETSGGQVHLFHRGL
jgi:hypothetical protein